MQHTDIMLKLIATSAQPDGPVQLGERGIGECQADDLRNRLAIFAQDWDAPEMNAYDELPSR